MPILHEGREAPDAVQSLPPHRYAKSSRSIVRPRRLLSPTVDHRAPRSRALRRYHSKPSPVIVEESATERWRRQSGRRGVEVGVGRRGKAEERLGGVNGMHRLIAGGETQAMSGRRRRGEAEPVVLSASVRSVVFPPCDRFLRQVDIDTVEGGLASDVDAAAMASRRAGCGRQEPVARRRDRA